MFENVRNNNESILNPNLDREESTNSYENHDSESKLAHNISQRFKNEDRFTGKLGENIEEYLGNYEVACEDYNLSETQKLRHLHNLFDEDAKRFFR